MRIYDPRVGRFLSADPLTVKYPMLTPYQFASNSVMDGVDKDGAEWDDYLSRMTRNFTSALKNYAKEQLIDGVNYVMGSTINYLKNEIEVVPYAKVEAKYTVGGRAALEFKKVAGGDVNLTSVELIGFTGEVNLKTGKFEGTVNYLNKDGKTVVSRGVGGSVSTLAGPVPVGMGASYTDEYVKNAKGEKEKTKKSYSQGASVFGVGLNGNIEREKDDSNNTQKSSAGVAAGIGAAIGVGIVAEYKIEFIGVKVETKH